MPDQPPVPPLSPTDAWPPLLLQPWPYWNQRSDPARDGDPGGGPNAANDCGPECCAMVVEYLTGVELDADYILDTMRTQLDAEAAGTIGYTSVADIQLFLKRFCDTPAGVVVASGPRARDMYLWHIWRSLVDGHPLIGLFSFSSPGSQDGHFRAICGMSPGTITTADPWTGGPRVESYDEHWAWAKGVLVECARKRGEVP